MNEDPFPKRSALIKGVSAKANFPRFDRANLFLFDPDQPREDPNDLLNRAHGGKMMDPASMNHNCPFCNRTMAWDLFLVHAESCFRKWRKVVRGQRTFAGAAPQVPQSVKVIGETAAASGGVHRIGE